MVDLTPISGLSVATLTAAGLWPDGLPLGGLAALVAGVLGLVAGGLTWRWHRSPARGPWDVPAGARADFRRARRALGRGRLERAAGLAAGLPPSRSVRILRGLVQAARAHRDGGVSRVLLEVGWVPRAADRAGTDSATLAAVEVAELMATRTELIDDLCADATSGRPVWTAERGQALAGLAGAKAPTSPRELAAWWETRRSLQTGPAAMTWAALRLLDSWSFASARSIARATGDPELVELLDLAAAAAGPVREGEDPGWRLRSLIQSPHFADELGLLLVGAPVVQELGASGVADRLRRRPALVARACELWPRYDDALSTTRPFVLHLLTDCGARHAANIGGFSRWWRTHQDAQRRFDAHLSAGLLSVQAGDWELAEHAFRDALTAWPERQCARFGLAVSLEARGDLAAASQLVMRLAADEPDEPLWQLKLGDLRVLAGEFEQALAHLEQCGALGGHVPGLSMRLGIVLARLGRSEEALFHLRAELGHEIGVEQLQPLAEALSMQSPDSDVAGRSLETTLGSRRDEAWTSPQAGARSDRERRMLDRLDRLRTAGEPDDDPEDNPEDDPDDIEDGLGGTDGGPTLH